MGSFGDSQNPWGSSYKDCSRGLCSIYCPQWCYLIFPPPPPPPISDSGDRDFSPLIIAVIGILATAFILLSYYTIVAKYCRSRRQNDNEGGGINDSSSVGRAGLEVGLIRSIGVYRYRRSERVVELADCAVCLSEFEEDDRLRLLPKCCHAFHVACIDAWLTSHSTCPLCRSDINDVSSSAAKHVVRGSEPVVVVVVDDGSEVGVRREEEGQGEGEGEEVLEPKSPMRSASFGLGSARLLVADILE